MPETKEITETEESEAAAATTKEEAAAAKKEAAAAAKKEAAAAKKEAAAAKKEAAAAKKPAKKRGRTKKAAAEPEVVPWEELMAGFVEEEVKDYSMKESFSKGEFIKHVKFGIGKVTGVIESSKVKVVFETGLKVLVQNR